MFKTILAVTIATLFANAGTALAADKPLITFAMPEIQGSFWVSMYYGVSEEAKAQGVDVIIVNAGGFDQVSKQIQQIENLAEKRPKVMLVGATNAAGVRSAVEKVIASGIPVIALGSTPEPKEKLASNVVADHYGLGRLQAECLAKEMNGTGTVGVMAGPPGVGWSIDRANGFKETIAKVAPNIKIVVEKSSVTGRVEGLKLMEDWLQGFPTIGGVYTPTDDMGAGAVDALLNANRAGTVKVSSSNLSPIGESYLRKNYIPCESVQQIVFQGREGVRQAMTLIRGGTPQKLITTPVMLITPENVDTVDYSLIKAPRDFRPR